MLTFLTAMFASSLFAFSAHAEPLTYHRASAPAAPLAFAALAEQASAGPVHRVPFYSQFADISSPKWQKIGCGITDLAMIVDFYRPGAASVETLLDEGIAAGAYLESAGWTYQGLIDVSKRYGLDGDYYGLAGMSDADALARLASYVEEGPVIASVHYKLEPTNPIPHLVVVDGIVGDVVYINDPAGAGALEEVSVDTFLAAWKKRFVVIRPTTGAGLASARMR